MTSRAVRSEKVAKYPDIFISYRRQEASYLAAWLHDTMSHRFGQASVFLDIDCIRPGADFLDEIDETLKKCSVLIVVIGQHWLSDPTGHRRIDDPDDPIRWEIELALDRGIKVVPVLLDGAAMPSAGELPESISRISRINAIALRREGAGADMRSLLDAVGHLRGSATGDLDRGPPEEVGNPGEWSAESDRRVVNQNEGQLQDQRFRLLSQLSHLFAERVGQSIDDEPGARLALELELCSARTFRAGDQFLGAPEIRSRSLRSGTDLLDVFDQSRGLLGDGLLVLGGPGSGKTTMLFEMAAGLVARAQTDSSHPIPVYLALQSWSERRQVLVEWAVAEMNKLYLVPPGLARMWIDNGRIMFLLDGLDEISSPVARRQCAEEINRFSRFGRPVRVPTVVASRTIEYDATGLALQLQAAVELRSLEPTKVLENLSHSVGTARAVAEMVRDDPSLIDLLSSPLLVTMLRLSSNPHDGQESPGGLAPLDPAHLVDSYLDRRLLLERQQNRERHNTYSPRTTRRYLRMLAAELSRGQQAVFLPDHLRRDVIASKFGRLLVKLAPPFLWALVLGVAAAVSIQLAVQWNSDPPSSFFGVVLAYCAMGVVAGLGSALGSYVRILIWLCLGMTSAVVEALPQTPLPSLSEVLIQGVGLAIFFGLLGELAVRLMCGELPLIGSISFSWAAARRYAVRSCLIGIAFAVLFDVPNWLASGLPISEAIVLGVFFGVILGLFVGMSLGLGRGVQVAPIPSRIHPNAEVRSSTRIGLTIGLLATAVGGGIFFLSGLVAGVDVGIVRAVAWGPGAGLLWGLATGLGAVTQYWVFRVLLWRYGRAPLRLLRWLEYAVQLRLLYRAGGGYVFIHKTVQDALAEDPSAAPPKGS